MKWTHNSDWKQLVNKLAKMLGVLVFIIGFGLLVIKARNKEISRTCNTVNIEVNDQHGVFFIDKTDIIATLARLDIDTFNNVEIAKVDLAFIEAELELIPHIKNAEAWIGNGCALNIEIAQRTPLVRVMHNEAVSYYLDINGKKMPLSRKFTARVPVISGLPLSVSELAIMDVTVREEIMQSDLQNTASINSLPNIQYNFRNTLSEGANKETAASRMYNEVMELSSWIAENKFWSAMIEQIHVSPQTDARKGSCQFELVPKVGDQIIELGGINDFEKKLDKLMTFYNEGMRYTGWDPYSRINLSFENQVVVTQK
ncbi:MAG: cell division protein FtsQ [Limisphaerales bacterium]|jgi:cell division protein FtsQ